jgi:hypothetical protein
MLSRPTIAIGFLMLISGFASPVPTPDLQNKALVRREMIAFNPQYIALMASRYRALKGLEQQVKKREAEFHDVSAKSGIGNTAGRGRGGPPNRSASTRSSFQSSASGHVSPDGFGPLQILVYGSRAQAERDSGVYLKSFGFIAESMFSFTPECRSLSSRNCLHVPPDSPLHQLEILIVIVCS